MSELKVGDDYDAEKRYCRQERIQHTDKLIELRARIVRYFAVSEQAAA